MCACRHNWKLDYEDAVQLQKELAGNILLTPLSKPVRLVAGGDISFNFKSDIAFAGFAVYDLEKKDFVERVAVQTELNYPYIPGLLSFREVPPLLEAWQKLSLEPDVVMLDGHGIAHPRKLGLASHFGLWVDIPTIGCAKNILVGNYEEPEMKKGESSAIWYQEEIVGKVLRTRSHIKPVFVSPGHKINLQQASDITLSSAPRYKIPEPTRGAHRLVNSRRKKFQKPENIN